jgi:hypothetical protein
MGHSLGDFPAWPWGFDLILRVDSHFSLTGFVIDGDTPLSLHRSIEGIQ